MMSEISDKLLQWYDANSRPLPWRQTRDAYHIWLCEIMCQQTRAEVAVNYYLRFLEAFPTVHALADAPEDAVLKLWEGLGYYARARNLHACAKVVSREMGGVFPATAEALRTLPGIGPYTANAIAAIVGGENVPALDGNLARVLTRLWAWEPVLDTPFDLLKPAMSMMDAQRPGDVNQAFMDLGAAVCKPRGADCAACPLLSLCRAGQAGTWADYPRKKAKKPKRTEEYTVLLAFAPEGLLIRKRPQEGLLGGLYMFPMLRRGETMAGFVPVEPLPHAKHVFTHIVWEMDGFIGKIGTVPEGWTAVRTLAPYAFPSALKAYTKIAARILAQEAFP